MVNGDELHTYACNNVVSRSVNVYDLPTTLSKYLNMGVPLPEIIARATIAPAAVINEPQLGHLKVGNPADIACFRIEEGEYVQRDAANNERIGKQMLVNTGNEILSVFVGMIDCNFR